ncbi:hypothetical protein CDAR_273001 [Caerostris darwini]|uniref:Uncharacterized protein n=1 Tax=Caerostris darwini TaxID=1538125 RepID=A0AAV4MK80_9ARAC|nr:hypothetical protein CDAR_273001 [Caerostris darwini]
MKRNSSRRFFPGRESSAFFTWGVRGRRMRGCRGAPASIIIIIIHTTPDSVGTEREGFPEEDSGGVPWLALQPAPDFFISIPSRRPVAIRNRTRPLQQWPQHPSPPADPSSKWGPRTPFLPILFLSTIPICHSGLLFALD